MAGEQWGTYPGDHTLTFPIAFNVPWILIQNSREGTAEDRLDNTTTLQPQSNKLANDGPPGGFYIALGK